MLRLLFGYLDSPSSSEGVLIETVWALISESGILVFLEWLEENPATPIFGKLLGMFNKKFGVFTSAPAFYRQYVSNNRPRNLRSLTRYATDPLLTHFPPSNINFPVIFNHISSIFDHFLPLNVDF